MKRLIAVFFLTLFLMYHIGYLGVYWYSQNQINQQWLVHMEISPDMKHVSIPISLPYWTETNYRPSQGTINIEGIKYRKVMERYADDAIHLLVLEDKASAKLTAEMADWVKAMSSSESDTSGKINFLNAIAKDYLSMTEIAIPENTFLLNPIEYFFYQDGLSTRSLEINSPPPQA